MNGIKLSRFLKDSKVKYLILFVYYYLKLHYYNAEAYSGLCETSIVEPFY